MNSSGSAITRKAYILYGIIICACCLVFVSLRLALTHTLPRPGVAGNIITADAAHVGHGLETGVLAVVHLPGTVARGVAHAADVAAFIRPADAVAVTVITAGPSRTVTAVVAAPATAVPAAAPAPPAARVAAVTTAAPGSYIANNYAWGNCTWWAASRRAQTGHPIPDNWGNAATWALRAAADGYVVDHTPSPGAIMQTPYSAHGLGHVAFVESVDPDGTWHISEMNVIGLGAVDRRAEPASAAASYNFIH